MRIKEWIAENIGYRFFGCFYNRGHDTIFAFVQSEIPKEFLHRNIIDLGCGDGANTIRVREAFKAQSIVGFDHNDFLLEKARRKGLQVKRLDFNQQLPHGELATFTFSLHHALDKEKKLGEVVENFRYIFLCEPILDVYHRLFDAGTPLLKQEWTDLFDRVLKKYDLYQHKNNLIVFYKKGVK